MHCYLCLVTFSISSSLIVDVAFTFIALELTSVRLAALPDGAQFGCHTTVAILLLSPALVTFGQRPTLLCRHVDLLAISVNSLM